MSVTYPIVDMLSRYEMTVIRDGNTLFLKRRFFSNPWLITRAREGAIHGKPVRAGSSSFDWMFAANIHSSVSHSHRTVGSVQVRFTALFTSLALVSFH